MIPGITAGVGRDPHFDNVVLLLHCNGTNGSTSLVDSSKYARSISAIGNAQISTAQFVFGGSSVYFDGAGDALSVPHDSALNTTNQDWCFEARVRLDAIAAYYAIFTKRLSDAGGGAGNDGEWQAFFDFGASPKRWGFGIRTSTYQGGTVGSGFAPSSGAWYALCIERSGATLRMMVNGVVAGAITLSGGTTAPSNSQPIVIGGSGQDIGAPFKGYMDEIRYTIGVARYSGAYTVSNAPFPDF